ncbi:unnamed protein product [Ixodes hexagonus]
MSSESQTGRLQDAGEAKPAIISAALPRESKEDIIMSADVPPPPLAIAVGAIKDAELELIMEEPKLEEPKMKELAKKSRKKVKGLRMPDGTYVGIKDKNKYLRYGTNKILF